MRKILAGLMLVGLTLATSGAAQAHEPCYQPSYEPCHRPTYEPCRPLVCHEPCYRPVYQEPCYKPVYEKPVYEKPCYRPVYEPCYRPSYEPCHRPCEEPCRHAPLTPAGVASERHSQQGRRPPGVPAGHPAGTPFSIISDPRVRRPLAAGRVVRPPGARAATAAPPGLRQTVRQTSRDIGLYTTLHPHLPGRAGVSVDGRNA